MFHNRKPKHILENILADTHNFGVNLYTRDIYLTGNLNNDNEDSESEIDWKVAINFIKNFHILESESKDQIIVHMLSIGGDVDCGMAIYNQILQSKCYVTCIAYGICASIAGVIFQSADQRILQPDCQFLIHMGHIGASDSSQAVKSLIEVNEKSIDRMLQIFASRAVKGKFFKGKTLDYVKNYIRKQVQEKTDFYIEPSTAIEFGLADAIFGESKYFSSLDIIRGVN